MPILLGFGGKPRSGKDTAALAIVEEFPDTRVYSISELICRELGVKREEVKDVSLLQREGARMAAGNPRFFVEKILGEIERDAPPIAIVPNVRRWEEAEFLRKKDFALVRFVRLNKNGSPFIARDRDPNDPLETDLDFFNWEYRITAKTGQVEWLKSQAVNFVVSLFRKSASILNQARPRGRGIDVAEAVKESVRGYVPRLHPPLWRNEKSHQMLTIIAASMLLDSGVGFGAIAGRIVGDIEARVSMGARKYGERLTTHNGRDAALDAYQEVLDAILYTGQKQLESGDAELMEAKA